jgi:hypothetical protein
MNSSVPSGWIARRPTRWSMPVSLQPRAPRRVRIVEAAHHRPVPESELGYRLHAQGQYQLEICLQNQEEEPRSVSLVNHSIRCTSERGRRVIEDDHVLYRYDLRWGRDDEAARPPRCWWSRPESLILRVEYADGREDFEQTLPVIIRPRRRWALGAFLSSAVLYGVIPWLSRTILDRGDLPAAWSQVLEVMSRSTVWLALMGLIVILWLAVVLSDQFQLWLQGRQLRRAICRDAQRYLERVQASER